MKTAILHKAGILLIAITITSCVSGYIPQRLTKDVIVSKKPRPQLNYEIVSNMYKMAVEDLGVEQELLQHGIAKKLYPFFQKDRPLISFYFDKKPDSNWYTFIPAFLTYFTIPYISRYNYTLDVEIIRDNEIVFKNVYKENTDLYTSWLILFYPPAYSRPLGDEVDRLAARENVRHFLEDYENGIAAKLDTPLKENKIISATSVGRVFRITRYEIVVIRNEKNLGALRNGMTVSLVGADGKTTGTMEIYALFHTNFKARLLQGYVSPNQEVVYEKNR